VANIFTEGSSIKNPVEQEALREYVVLFTPENRELAHNLEVLENISNAEALSDEGILEGVRLGRDSYSIKPTEVYAINNDGGKVFVTGKPDSANRIAFHAYQTSPDNTLGGIDASPYLNVHKVKLMMTRKTVEKDGKLDPKNSFEFVHSYPQINTDIFFIGWDGDIPETYLLGQTGHVGWMEEVSISA